MRSFVWTFILLGLAAVVVPTLCAQENPPAAQSPAYQITGSVHSGKTPLPGVTLTATSTLTGKKFSAATISGGSFVFIALPRGRYVVRTEFMGFAAQTQEVVLNPENPSGKADFELILASRQQEQTNQLAAAAASAVRGFQSLTMDSTESALAGSESGAASMGQTPSASDLAALPLNGAGADAPTESVSISGVQGRTQDFGAGNESELEERIQEFRERAQQMGIGGFAGGGPGGFGGGGPGGGGPMVIRLGRGGFNVNQPHGFLYFSDDTSALDARPYSLSGLELPRADYNQARFEANVGGPLNIPKIFNGGNKTFFFRGLEREARQLAV